MEEQINTCDSNNSDCHDKKSMHYFIYHMTQKEFLKFRLRSYVNMGCETGLTREERYIFNKIKIDEIQKLGE